MSPTNKHILEWTKANGHAHTNFSDGTGNGIDMFWQAMELCMILGITDHNTVAALEQLMTYCEENPHVGQFVKKVILGGSEIQSLQGPELLIYGKTIAETIRFFKDNIQKTLDPHNPIFAPTNIPIHRLIGMCREQQMHIVIPHPFARHFGIMRLPIHQTARAIHELKKHSGHVAVERNEHMGRIQNAASVGLAKACNWPLISTGDSHTNAHDSYVEIKHDCMRSELPANQAFFEQIHASHPTLAKQHIETRSMLAQTKIFAQCIWQMGRQGLKSFAWREIQHWRGNLPTRKLLLPRKMQTTGAVDGGDF